MVVLRVTQPALALACGLSQPHLSKVLSKKVRLAGKTEARLLAWLRATESGSRKVARSTTEALAGRIERLRPDRHLQVIELLTSIEKLLKD